MNYEEARGRVGKSEHIILNDIDISDIAEQIMDDITTAKLISGQKVNNAKARIADIIKCYKKKTMEVSTSTESANRDMADIYRERNTGLRKSVIGLYDKAKIDVKFVHLYDRTTAEETKQNIRRKIVDDNLSQFKEKTQEEIHKIKEETQALTSATKLLINDYLKANMGTDKASEPESFHATDLVTKKQIDQTKQEIRENLHVLLVNPTGKKTVEEIESEKFITENFVQFERKLKDDLQAQKEALDETVKNIKNKVRSVVPF